tara:strand:- start:255 stop:1298 length:1044 start_codon:yes stop_codon:yes gene_type:complete
VSRNDHPTAADMELIYPFVEKRGSLSSFKTISATSYAQDFAFGDLVTGSYPLTSSISINRYGNSLTSDKKRVLYALRTTLDRYSGLNDHYAYSSPTHGEKESQYLNLISIPSIFYGSGIKKGSVSLKYFITGSLLSEASDIHKDGRLIQTSGAFTGHTVGVVLYHEGFIMLTGSADLKTTTDHATHVENYNPVSPFTANANWQNWGVQDAAHVSATQPGGAPSSSFSLDFKGTNYVNTVTMLAHAERNELNFSNNPTFLSSVSELGTEQNFNASYTSSSYAESPNLKIQNIVSSSYQGYTASFKPITYITKIGIYDKDKNLIAIASLANPVKKTEETNYTFKLKLDI